MGDFNAEVGNSKHEMVVGPFGLGERNDQGQTLIQWCEEKDLVSMNTWFKHHKRLYTWKSPGDQFRNQICINQRFRNRIKQCKTIPSADCNSDHVLLSANMECRLKKIKTTKNEPKLDFSILRNNNVIGNQFKIEVTNRFNALEIEQWQAKDPCENWNQLERYLQKALKRSYQIENTK